MDTILEVCCGSYEDVLCAQRGGADRVELNAALHMGGLTPSLATLSLAKQHSQIPIIAMIRPRGGGFCYSTYDQEVMLEDAELLLKQGADGLAFGFLKEDRTIDMELTKRMIERIHAYHREAVFHRAFDCVSDMDTAITQLVTLGIDRILTSGGKVDAVAGMRQLAYLQQTYGHQVTLLAGCGVRAENVEELQRTTGIRQLHSSCKTWKNDPTTSGKDVSYAYAASPHTMEYDVVSEELVRAMKHAVKKSNR